MTFTLPLNASSFNGHFKPNTNLQLTLVVEPLLALSPYSKKLLGLSLGLKLDGWIFLGSQVPTQLSLSVILTLWKHQNDTEQTFQKLSVNKDVPTHVSMLKRCVLKKVCVV